MSRKLPIIFALFVLLFLLKSESNYATTPDNSDSLQPGTASGKLSVNVQTFKMKYAYARKQSDENEAAYLVMLTNRKFPQDFSKITRFELDEYADRYDLHGVALGIDNNQHLVFIDVLRVQRMIGTAEFQIDPIKQGAIEGRVHTKGEIRFLRNRVKFDLKFNAKLQP